MCQNLYDTEHSREFARYLMQTHQFQLASAEWERVLFLNPQDSLAQLSQIQSFRLGQNPEEGWKKLNRWYPDGPLPRPFSIEAIRISLVRADYSSFQTVLKRSTGLTLQEKSNYEMGSWLLEGNWIKKKSADKEPAFALAATDTKLLDLYFRTKSINRKSPATSVALSAIVPGLGKVYSHDWKDGLLSLLFVATNAWQSYRGFSKNGIKSVTGWVFGGLAVGFYSANLFGSWKSAKIYNSNQVELIRHETEGILFTR
jgi:hypothetical protein